MCGININSGSFGGAHFEVTLGGELLPQSGACHLAHGIGLGLGGTQEGLGHAMKHGHHITSSTKGLLHIQLTTSACRTCQLIGILPSDDTEQEKRVKELR